MRVTLGKTQLEVHPIGLGANAVGGHNIYPNLDDNVGLEVVRTTLEENMNFLDTAYSYGNGRSEELIGKVLKERGRREDVVIATKAAQREEDGRRVLDNSPEFLKKSVEESLKRLQTDYIDLFYIHHPDEETNKAEAVGALRELKEEGKIRAIGVSNFTMEQLKEANQDGYVDVYQGEYNLLNRKAEEEYFPYMKKNKISFVPYFPLVSGLLAGKYDENTTFPEDDLRSKQAHFQGELFHENLEKVNKIRKIAQRHQAEVAHIVLAWYLTKEEIDVIIPGAKRPEQVISNRKTVEIQLSEEEIKEIGTIFQ